MTRPEPETLAALLHDTWDQHCTVTLNGGPAYPPTRWEDCHSAHREACRLALAAVSGRIADALGEARDRWAAEHADDPDTYHEGYLDAVDMAEQAVREMGGAS